VEAPVAALSPGTKWESVAPKVKRLGPLARHIQDMVIASGGQDGWAMTPEERRALLRSRKSPIDYAYVDLTEGVHYVYPGIDALPPDYDVRTSSFYTMSANRHGRRWGSPYVDSTTDEQGDDLVLPCTQGLWSPHGDFLGVAGVEITVTKLVETSMVLPGRSTVRTSLLDEQGRKVVDSRDAGKRFRSSGKDVGLELEPFDLPQVAEAVRAGKEGLVTAERNGEPVVVVHSRIPALGWTYVVEVAEQGLGAR
jgi:hypothetical protein